MNPFQILVSNSSGSESVVDTVPVYVFTSPERNPDGTPLFRSQHMSLAEMIDHSPTFAEVAKVLFPMTDGRYRFDPPSTARPGLTSFHCNELRFEMSNDPDLYQEVMNRLGKFVSRNLEMFDKSTKNSDILLHELVDQCF